jgi:hypothetical protein
MLIEAGREWLLLGELRSDVTLDEVIRDPVERVIGEERQEMVLELPLVVGGSTAITSLAQGVVLDYALIRTPPLRSG